MTGRAVVLPSALISSRLLGAPAPSRRVKAERVGYALGSPGSPSAVPTLLITVFDDSGSVMTPHGTDPLSNRYAEVQRAFTEVARKGSRHELGAVLHFDTLTSADVPPTPITRRGLLRLRAGLHPPTDRIGTSELAPSLTRAVEIAETHPGHETTLVVLSDFMLMDPEPGHVLTDLANFPGTVHAVVLGTHLPAGVLDERIAVTTIDHASRPGAVARALFASLVTRRPGSRVATEP
jgi:hypothetical protein